MRRRYKVLVIIISLLAFIFLILPYLAPVSQNYSQIALEALATPSGRFLNIGSERVYIEEQGLQFTPVIILIHGFGGSTFTWRDNIPFLAQQGFHVIAIDLRGFGLSSREPDADYSHKAQAALVAAALQQLQIKQAYFIGHSMGGNIMLHLAHSNPELMLGLVSVDGAVNLKAGSHLPAVLLGFPPFDRAGRVILTNYISRTRFVSFLTSAYFRQEILDSYVIDGYYNRAIRPGWEKSLFAMTQVSARNVIDFPLSSINAPTLILRGAKDTWVSQADTDNWKDQIQRSAFKLIPDSGHLPMEEQPAFFNETVVDFIQSIQKQ
jgi:pimeloyl-ACP methyl ester carboxylesterase